MKRLIAVCVLLCCVLCGVFALEASVTWNWYRNDRAVKYYRYQLDGEAEDGWTVVGSNVYEISLDVDVSEVHVLYLQQSYDGIHWSESSCTESEIYEDSGYVEEDDFFWDEIEDFPEEEPEEVEEVVVVEEVPVEAPVAEKKVKTSKSFINLAISYRNSIPNDEVEKNLGFVFSYSHLFPYQGNAFTSGLRIENSYYSTRLIFNGLDKTDYFITASIMGIMSFSPSKGDFSIGFGPEIQLQFGTVEPTIYYGLNSVLAVRFTLTDKLSLGLSTSDHFYFYPEKVNIYDFRAGISVNV